MFTHATKMICESVQKMFVQNIRNVMEFMCTWKYSFNPSTEIIYLCLCPEGTQVLAWCYGFYVAKSLLFWIRLEAALKIQACVCG
jgi:hypothetical protein